MLDAHELTARAVVHRDYGALRSAMLTDPLVNSIADADCIIEEIMELAKDALPADWFAATAS